MRGRVVAGLAWLVSLAGCAVVRSTDVTDVDFKRHRSIAILGWPVYTRVTDQVPGSSGHLVTKEAGSSSGLRPAELTEFLPPGAARGPTQNGVSE